MCIPPPSIRWVMMSVSKCGIITNENVMGMGYASYLMIAKLCFWLRYSLIYFLQLLDDRLS